MKKSITPLLYGIVFIVAGLAYIASIFLDWNYNFDGWWALLIMVPAFISILSSGFKAFNSIVFLVGATLFASEQGFIKDEQVGIAIIATVIIYVGIILIVHYIKGPKAKIDYSQYGYQNVNTNMGEMGANSESQSGYAPNNSGENHQNPQDKKKHHSSKFSNIDNDPMPNYNAILSGVDAKNTSTDFKGAKISAIMGGADIDLRDVVITEDITIYITTIMGGVDVYAPRNVRIGVNKTNILGGTDCKAYTMPADANVPLVNFVCTTIMGGIDIK